MAVEVYRNLRAKRGRGACVGGRVCERPLAYVLDRPEFRAVSERMYLWAAVLALYGILIALAFCSQGPNAPR